MPVYRLGIISDLRIGLTGQTTCHKRLLGDRALEILRFAVAELKPSLKETAI